MPCIVNQVQVSGKDQVMISEGTVHVGIICTGCNMNPITGIRYKCLQCSEFNLCQICEEKVTHEHDLLKMKVVRAE